MLSRQTIDKLYRLKLPAMAESYQRFSEEPESLALSFDDRVGIMVDAEWTAKQNKKISRLIKSSGIVQEASLENLDFRLDRRLNRDLIATLSEGSWITNHRNLLITGKTGVGKSYLLSALGNKACRLGYTVNYVRLSRLLIDLEIAKMEGTYNKFLNQLSKLSLLMVDDFGLAEITPGESREILEVIDGRLHTGSLILASQKPVKEWYPLFVDPTLADACLDRLVHNSYRIELEGDSMRRWMAMEEKEKEKKSDD